MTTSTPEEATEPPKTEDEMNPKKRPLPDDSDAEKLAARREANRIHALKSRQRSKALLQELQRTVTQLSGEKAELERENAVMRAQIDVLQQQNIALTQSQRMLLMRAGQLGGAPGAAAMNPFAAGLFGLSQAASMPSAAPTTTAANTPGTASNASGAPSSGAPSGENGGVDQAAVAAAAAAMIQGQAAATAAAFNPQLQHLMGAFPGIHAAPPPANPVPAPAVPVPAPATTATTTTTTPAATSHAPPAPAPSQVAAPTTTAVPDMTVIGDVQPTPVLPTEADA